MQTTEKNLKEKKQSLAVRQEEKTRFLGYTKTLEAGMQQESVGLSKSLANSLMNLIEKVNDPDVTPETVNASSNAAAQIYKILRLNYEMKKDGF